jgi:pimeloyl-ACP methyl ester carboxylesterase
MNGILKIPFLAGIVLLTACATPSERFAQAADDFGFARYTVTSGKFDHFLSVNPGFYAAPGSGELHVYLDGDGTPWERHRWIADDPTSRNPMILEWMKEDKGAAVFLGRPCYHGFSQTPGCHYKYWTSHRYSETVVSSMAAALKQWLLNRPFKRIILIGYSGGGTLAMLMTRYLAGVDTVVTVAANLEVDAWSRFHGYGPLKDSLDPGAVNFDSRIRQIHLAGLKDEIVPADIIESFSHKQQNAKYMSFAEYDHRCCWSQGWNHILALLHEPRR